MSNDHTDKKNPESTNLGICKEVLLDGFDGDDRAVLVLELKKPLQIQGHTRRFAGIVLEEKQLSELARQLLMIAKRKRRSVSRIILP